MEYIQCSHCFKKYAVNDKVRAASGKNIACTGCGKEFEITVFSTPSAPPSSKESSERAEEHYEEVSETATDRESEKRYGIKIDKNMLQIIITSILGIVLITALVLAYQFMSDPEPVENPIVEPAKQSEKSEPQAREKRAAGKKSDAPTEKEKSKITTANMPVDGAYRGPPDPSDDCKQAATEQWFTDYMITHGSITSREYIRLLDQSSSQTAEVLKLCKDRYLASRITESARLDETPAWIKDEIEARSLSQYNSTEKAGGDAW